MRASQGLTARPDLQPNASVTLKHREATSTGSAIRPEPRIPSEKSTGPRLPNEPRAIEAARVLMLLGSGTCNWEAATIAEREIIQATRVPACDSLTCACARPAGRPRLELVCHTMTSGVSREPKTATTAIM